MELENTEVLTTEPRWFERGVKEDTYVRALNPSLNRDGGRYNLPRVWDNIIKKRVKADRPRRGGWPRHHRLAQRPRQHHRDVLTDEADSRRRKLLFLCFLLGVGYGYKCFRGREERGQEINRTKFNKA